MGQVILVRHGQTRVDASGVEGLAPLGWEQSRLAGEALRARGVRPTLVASGTARCHLESLEAVGDAAGWDDVPGALDSGWDEFDHDVLVQRFPALAGERESSPAELQHWFEAAAREWTNGAAGVGETFRGFMVRVGTALAEVLEMTGPRDTTVVVTSAGAIAAIASTLLLPDADGELWQRLNSVIVHGSTSTLSIGPRGAALVSFNEHAHLQSGR